MVEIIKPEEKKILWEILVPTMLSIRLKEGDPVQHVEISKELHEKWDNKILEISGSDGLTRPPAAHGLWENPDGKLFKEKMLPVRFMAAEDVIDEIIKFTKQYYKQEKIMCYAISEKVYLY